MTESNSDTGYRKCFCPNCHGCLRARRTVYRHHKLFGLNRSGWSECQSESNVPTKKAKFSDSHKSDLEGEFLNILFDLDVDYQLLFHLSLQQHILACPVNVMSRTEEKKRCISELIIVKQFWIIMLMLLLISYDSRELNCAVGIWVEHSKTFAKTKSI